MWGFLVSPLASSVSQTGQSQLRDVVNIDFRTDVRLFTVMAALKAAGFEYGSSSSTEEMSEVQRLVSEQLAQLDPELVNRLKVYFSLRRFGDDQALHTAYTSLALLLTGPPEFEIRKDAFGIPVDVREILGFEELLPEFYRAAKIPQLWERLRTRYAAELEAYSPVVKRVIRETLEYFRIPARVVLDRNIILMADLLGLREVVNARNLERSYFIVVGPTSDPEKNFVQLQHEYLHFLIDPLAEKYAGQLMKQRELLDLAHDQPNLTDDFRNRFILIAAESMIEAVVQRLHPPEDLDARMVELFRRGFIFTPFFYRSLEKFESMEGTSFPAYLDDVIGEIDPSSIRSDAGEIEKVESRLDAGKARRREALAREREKQEEAARRGAELERAGQLMARREFATARPIFEKILEEEPDNGVALFYLGQVSSQMGDHASALNYYGRVEEAGGVDIWVHAWSRLRMGRILASRQDWEGARRQFESVLEMEGDLRGADQEARDLLSRLPSAPDP